MKINEVEERVGISKANIRFYEKQGLLSPARSANGYREYSEEDILRLQQIIILRKLGISVQDIEKIQKGELSLQDAIQTNIIQLEEQIEQLTGSLRLSRQIAAEEAPELDTSRYWQIIQKREAEGERFADVVSEYWAVIMEPMILKRFMLDEKDNLRKRILQIAGICGIYALVRTFVWKNGNLIGNFLYWPMIFAVGALITFPLFWMTKHFPKTVTVITTVLLVVCVVIVGAAFLLAAGGLVLMVKDFLFG